MLFSISSAIIAVFTFLFPLHNLRNFFQLLCCVLQLLLMPIPFYFKRTKNGMPFLQKEIYAIPVMIIGTLVLFAATTINNSMYSILFFTAFFLVLILSLLIHHYWKSNLTKTYIDKLNERNLTDLNSVLSGKNEYITQLEQENKRLAKIIHKDNKLIPAMELAVQNYISASNSEDTDALATGKQLLEELAKLSEERKGIIFQQDMQCQKLPSANVMSIDNLLTYMQQKALESDITFNVTISCDIPYLVEHIIEETELNTLLADLIENALIATRYNKGHHILLNMGIVSNAYSINIFDSGIPFTKEVLAKWGLEQITTHKDDDGSGIGLMTAYEIIKRHNASFMINEFASENGLYTKETAVLFNNLNQYILHTARTEEELAELNQRSDLLIIRK
ncbi:MAG: hypothetical protein PUC12_15100 [Clostridiales bacterium]|nr:hypothetical protein [Clostridiales bacterium]